MELVHFLDCLVSPGTWFSYGGLPRKMHLAPLRAGFAGRRYRSTGPQAALGRRGSVGRRKTLEKYPHLLLPEIQRSKAERDREAFQDKRGGGVPGKPETGTEGRERSAVESGDRSGGGVFQYCQKLRPDSLLMGDPLVSVPLFPVTLTQMPIFTSRFHFPQEGRRGIAAPRPVAGDSAHVVTPAARRRAGAAEART